MICPHCKDLSKRPSGFKKMGDVTHYRYICSNPDCRKEFYDPPLPEETK